MRSSLEQRVIDLENAGSVTTFLALTDTPAAYTGQSLKVVRVNAGETALEFVTLAGGGDMLAANNLSDVANVATARTNLGLNTTANQTDSTDKRFMTDAQEAKLDAITGTNTGDQTSIVGISGTKAQFDTACSDGNFLYVGDVVGVTDGDKGDITVSSSGTVWTIDNSTVTEAKMSLADNTTNDVSTTKHGFVPKAPNDTTKFLRGDATWDVPTDPAGWTTILKSANQDVTNNATLQNDTELQFSVVAGGHYMVEMDVATSGNSTVADYKFGFLVSAGTMKLRGLALHITSGGSIGNTLLSAAGTAATTSVTSAILNNDFDYLQPMMFKIQFTASANATFSFQFANNTAGASLTSRTWKGSILKYKRID